jgi:hypothetical protein
VVLRDLAPNSEVSADRERFSVRIIVLAPKPAHNQYYMAGVIAHELGHAFHSHKGKAILADEYAADDKACDWDCGRFLMEGLQADLRDDVLGNGTREELEQRIARLRR